MTCSLLYFGNMKGYTASTKESQSHDDEQVVPVCGAQVVFRQGAGCWHVIPAETISPTPPYSVAPRGRFQSFHFQRLSDGMAPCTRFHPGAGRSGARPGGYRHWMVRWRRPVESHSGSGRTLHARGGNEQVVAGQPPASVPQPVCVAGSSAPDI